MQGLDQQSTLKSLIYMYKASAVCPQKQNDFRVCRATPAGQAEPERCEEKASSFLSCYHEMVKSSVANCASEYAATYKCMEKNVSLEDDETGACSNTIN